MRSLRRADSEDDGSRLRQRVAELEGVIRQVCSPLSRRLHCANGSDR